jgi:mycothiol synthase
MRRPLERQPGHPAFKRGAVLAENPVRMFRPQPIEQHELEEALGLVLASPKSRHAASRAQVRTFLAYLDQTRVRWEGWRHPDRSQGLLLVLRIPGRTAVLMMSEPGRDNTRRQTLQELIRHWCALASARSLHFAQALIEPEASGKRAALRAGGFARLTRLLYLERDARFPWCDPPAAAELEWICYTPQHEARFMETLQQTYHKSLDCPELTSLRSVQDALASHRASGPFDPRLWELARLAGRDAGCLLLSGVPQVAALEVVYMGVAAAHRRQGVGALLLRRALQQARERGVERLTLVVDERNHPARRLYERFCFAPITQRDAYLLRLGVDGGK